MADKFLETIIEAEKKRKNSPMNKIGRSLYVFGNGLINGLLPRESVENNCGNNHANAYKLATINGISEFVVGAGLITAGIATGGVAYYIVGGALAAEAGIRKAVSMTQNNRAVGSFLQLAPVAILLMPFILCYDEKRHKAKQERKLREVELKYPGVVFHDQEKIENLELQFNYYLHDRSDNIPFLEQPSNYLADLIGEDRSRTCFYLNEIKIKNPLFLNKINKLALKCLNAEKYECASSVKKIHNTKIKLKTEFASLIAQYEHELEPRFENITRRFRKRRDVYL